jgi:hypothetical protein
MKQNQLRPLRLVQQEEESQKRANRGSWMGSGLSGWFKGNTNEANANND